MSGSEDSDSVFGDIFNFFSSMKAGLILLIILAALSSLGSFIPQKEDPGVYYEEYSEIVADIILTLGIDNIFEVWWFVGLVGLVCANIFLCNLKRFPGIYKRAFKPHKVISENDIKSNQNSSELNFNFSEEVVVETVKDELQSWRYKTEVKENDKKEKVIFAEKGRFAYLGSLMTHLSILIIVIGFAYGNYVGFEDFVYGVPGDVVKVEKADFDLKINDFEIDYRDDYSVKQYYSTLTVKEEKEKVKKEQIHVNRPLRYAGVNFYQSTHGWSGKLTMENESDNFSNTVRIYEGEHYHYNPNPGESKVVHFRAFYPDYDIGVDGPINRSPKTNNPHFIWQLYVDGHMEDMFVSEPGETVEYGDTKIKFHDYSQYTGLSVVSDPGVPAFIAGSIIMCIGLVLSFYFYPRRIWAVISQEGSGSEHRLVIGGRGLKDRASFKYEFERILEKIKDKEGDKSG